MIRLLLSRYCSKTIIFHQSRLTGTCTSENDEVLEDSDSFGTLNHDENYEENYFKEAKETVVSKAAKDYAINNSFTIKPVYESNNVKIEKSINNVLLNKESLQPSTTINTNEKKIKTEIKKPERRYEDEHDVNTFTLPTELYGNRLSYNKYGRKISALAKERKLKEAIHVLEVEMVAQYVKPDKYCYQVLINACGKAGYTQKSFELFHKMKQNGLTPEKFAYTGLFNACANSPIDKREYSLHQAVNLRKQVKDRNIPLSPISYHAMIKAFGRLGEISTAFEIVDDMLIDRHTVITETMNFLLQACISDKEAGFRHAVKVWRKMRMLHLKPCIYSYNLLLRCTKECNAGDQKLLHELLETIPSKQSKIKKHLIEERKVAQDLRLILDGKKDPPEAEIEKKVVPLAVYQITDKNESVKVNLKENMELELCAAPLTVVEKKVTVLPDLLAKRFSKGQVVDLIALDKAEDRLALLGGPSAILKQMLRDRVEPTIITFTYLLESLPNTLEIEESLISSMKSFNVKPDVIFCNILIRKRQTSGRYKEAKDVLNLMQELDIIPDLITFGCIAIGCKIPHEASKLLSDLKEMGVRPNEEIMSTLISRSLREKDFLYSLDLLKMLRSYDITASARILHNLEETRKSIRKTFHDLESGVTKKEDLSKRDLQRHDEMRVFLYEYKIWLTRSNVRMRDHPWAQYGHVEKPLVGSRVISVAR